jgi:DNA-binding FadR family transcriptional regulator
MATKRARQSMQPAAQGSRGVKSKGVLNQLGMQIVSGRPAPGERLPGEADLSRRFRISRASLREALQALVRKG